MTRLDEVTEVVEYWLGKAASALESAESELEAGRTSFAINRCYYACYYAASAVLLARGKKFVKHSGVRAAVHRDLVKPGHLPEAVGLAYDRLFDRRQEADYTELMEFSKADAKRYLADAREVESRLKALLERATR